MLDNDGDTLWIFSMFTRLLAVAIVVWAIASENERDCAELICTGVSEAQLIRGACLCVTRPAERTD